MYLTKKKKKRSTIKLKCRNDDVCFHPCHHSVLRDNERTNDHLKSQLIKKVVKVVFMSKLTILLLLVWFC